MLPTPARAGSGRGSQWREKLETNPWATRSRTRGPSEKTRLEKLRLQRAEPAQFRGGLRRMERTPEISIPERRPVSFHREPFRARWPSLEQARRVPRAEILPCDPR